jgi:[ribosomal protein S5]-alanine N-acetyltransferase
VREYFMKSARLGFSTWQEGDIDEAMQLWGDPEVTRLIVAGGKMTKEQVLERLTREMATQRDAGIQYWPVFSLETGEFSGCCGLRPYSQEKNILETGTHIKRKFWGQGLAQEASLRVFEYAFDVLKADALFAGHNPANSTSRHVLTKLGFEHTHDEFYAPTGLNHPSYLLSREKYLRTAKAQYDSTWSLVARDPGTGELGVIVTTKRPAVGNRCPWAVAGVGAVSTQALSNPLLAQRVLGLLSGGLDARASLELALSEDLDKEARQVGVVDWRGTAAAFTGGKADEWKGHYTGRGYSTQGNILAGEGVIAQTASTFEQSKGPLVYRLLDAMDAGQEAGGDSRGRQSAAILIVKPGWLPYINVRVDDHEYPLAELRRQVELWMNVVRASKPHPQLGNRLVCLRSAGRDVADIQAMLRDLGFYRGPIDGSFGKAMNTAVRAFQQQHQVRVDGIIGPEAVSKLTAAYEARYHETVT